MALVEDVIPAGRVEGVVVDRTHACELTATADTWITTTLETIDALDDDEVCFVPAGEKLTYLHASQDMLSQRRLHMDGGGPCAGIGELDTLAFVWAPSFTDLCEPETMAAHEGVTVMLDGQSVEVDDEGRFAFEGIAPGPHTVEVLSDGSYHGTIEPVDVEVYPGARVVIGLTPAAQGSGDDGSSEGGGAESSESGDGSSASAGADATTDDESSTSPQSAGFAAELDDGQEAACGCTTPTQPRRDMLLLGLLTLFVGHRHRSRVRRA
jgi:hypothetical protein